jgi:8-oxo-dGTP pyrophosphatase MutT (NUDIX family)
MAIEKTETKFRGRVITVNVETVKLPNGHTVDLEIIHHPGGAAVVALDGEERVCLLRQFRHAANGWIWELPAGKLEPHEPAFDTARRELIEEAGVHAREWFSLGTSLSSPGVFDEIIHLFLATGLEPVAASPEANEVFEVHWIPFAQARSWALSGPITDSKTVTGLMRASLLRSSDLRRL